MKKILVTSFYNTLIDKEDAIPLSTMLQIERIRKQGVLFVVNTNRHIYEILDYNRDFPFVDYVIGLNGAYVYDLKNESTIYKKSIDKELINKILEKYKNHKIKLYDEQKETDIFENQEIYKIEIELSQREYKKFVIEKIDSLNITTLKYDKKYYIEYTSNETNNYKALQRICDKNDDVVAVIGNDSDKVILDNIKNTYVVSNCKSLKSLAKLTTKSNNFKGVEAVIKKIISNL